MASVKAGWTPEEEKEFGKALKQQMLITTPLTVTMTLRWLDLVNKGVYWGRGDFGAGRALSLTCDPDNYVAGYPRDALLTHPVPSHAFPRPPEKGKQEFSCASTSCHSPWVSKPSHSALSCRWNSRRCVTLMAWSF